ncbi:MAG: AAA family ATPase, partial [Acetobacteraceae bacterium]|nr:AAA family ATPase [Acetobacteraceae bacterium]
MPVRFSRLRIAGFKSFAEPATVDILPGLTGIVGPNGCGKSNVVEALRWAMGESSARSLRGGEMEDVIFSGTAGRASRNIAEVGLVLHDTQGLAPAPFTELGEIEIVRRIERGAGSAYRVNGKEVRARDIQTLFADLASGARASAMVSQGRVGALVAARPEERRAVLEEAAGITGLHARRHEAELKLRQAEANLARAEDLKGQLDTQLAALKRQARQASRYRNLSGAIRQGEAELLSVQRARVERAREAARAAVAAARGMVAQAEAAARTARSEAEALATALPGLRETEAEARTELERRRIAGEQIAAEAERARAALAEAERRAAQIAKDIAHAEQAAGDAAAAEERLAAEEHRLAEAEAAHPARVEAAARTALEAEEAARGTEAEAQRATEAAAEAQARAQAVAQRLREAEARARRAGEQLDGASQERDRIRAKSVDPERVAAAGEEQAAAEAGLEAARAAQEAAERERARAQAALAEARAGLSAAEAARAKLAAEARALAEVLAVKDGERWPPMVDAVTVPAGLEAALGAALGEELTSAADPEAARHWRVLPPLDPPALPEGARRLSELVHLSEEATPLPPEQAGERGSAALRRALSYIGLVADEAAGDAAQALLAPGQMLVSAAGALWRWDGYTVRAGTPTEAAVRLRQRNRLGALRAELARAEARAAEAGTAHQAAEAAEREAGAAEQRRRQARREAEQRVERARTAFAQLRAEAESLAARLN